MPHFTIEYSSNLDNRTDIAAACNAVLAAALQTNLFELGAVRVRAVRCEHYAIADQLPKNAFAHVILRMGVGRSAADRKAAGDAVFGALTTHFAPLFNTPHFALSFEIVEIDGDLSWKKNAIHPRTRALEKK
jgi:5-carboxymethyl-2-hydroxymuconate isomerase